MRPPISAYVHVPFCTVKCGYCDFNAYSGMDNLKDAYGKALVREVHTHSQLLAGRSIRTVGFGGGTPGEVPAAAIAAVIDAFRAASALLPDAEVSLEANPGTTTGAALRELRTAGVNRLSFGAQSFDGEELRFLDRIHSPEAIAASVRLARDAGFESIGLDLIYGIPGQTSESWKCSLAAAVALGVDHVSCYALTVEDATPLARRVRTGDAVMADADEVADLYEQATDALAVAGFEQYELSNWARPGHQSRHNRVYWTDGEYLGVGAGAHGYVAGERYENIAHPREYIAAVEAESSVWPAVTNRYTPDAPMAMSDWLMLRLRLIEGFDPADFERRFRMEVHVVVGDVLSECEAAGVLERSPRIRLTARGRLLHGEVAARLAAHLNRKLAVAVEAD